MHFIPIILKGYTFVVFYLSCLQKCLLVDMLRFVKTLTIKKKKLNLF